MVNWNLVYNVQPVLKPLSDHLPCLATKKVKQALLLWVSPEHFILSEMHGIPFLGHERG